MYKPRILHAKGWWGCIVRLSEKLLVSAVWIVGGCARYGIVKVCLTVDTVTASINWWCNSCLSCSCDYFFFCHKDWRKSLTVSSGDFYINFVAEFMYAFTSCHCCVYFILLTRILTFLCVNGTSWEIEISFKVWIFDCFLWYLTGGLFFSGWEACNDDGERAAAGGKAALL